MNTQCAYGPGPCRDLLQQLKQWLAKLDQPNMQNSDDCDSCQHCRLWTAMKASLEWYEDYMVVESAVLAVIHRCTISGVHMLLGFQLHVYMISLPYMRQVQHELLAVEVLYT